MAKTDNTIAPALTQEGKKAFWTASVYSNDADTTSTVEIHAAASSGVLCVDHILVVCDQDPSTISIMDGTNVLFGPYEITATEYGGFVDINLKRAVKLSGALGVKCGANAPVNVLAEGFIAGG